MRPLRFGPTGLGKSAWGNAPVGIDHTTICPAGATQNRLVEPIQGSSLHGTLTWGGVHPRSWILLPQADVYEPVRLNRNNRSTIHFTNRCQRALHFLQSPNSHESGYAQCSRYKSKNVPRPQSTFTRFTNPMVGRRRPLPIRKRSAASAFRRTSGMLQPPRS